MQLYETVDPNGNYATEGDSELDTRILRDRSRWLRHHPVSRRGEVGTVENGGPGATSTAVVVLITQGAGLCYARVLQKAAKGWRNSDDLRITEHRTEKPDTELSSRMGKQRTSR